MHRLRDVSAIFALLFVSISCGDVVVPSDRHVNDRSLMSADVVPYCDGGTCVQLQATIGGMPNPLWVAAAAEADRLLYMGDARCNFIGGALSSMLTRGALYIRTEGPAMTQEGLASGRYDPNPGGNFFLPVYGQMYQEHGEAWIAPGNYTSWEDGSSMNTIDVIRHEAAHAIIDWDGDPVFGNQIIGDLGSGTTFTAQQAASQCR